MNIIKLINYKKKNKKRKLDNINIYRTKLCVNEREFILQNKNIFVTQKLSAIVFWDP